MSAETVGTWLAPACAVWNIQPVVRTSNTNHGKLEPLEHRVMIVVNIATNVKRLSVSIKGWRSNSALTRNGTIVIGVAIRRKPNPNVIKFASITSTISDNNVFGTGETNVVGSADLVLLRVILHAGRGVSSDKDCGVACVIQVSSLHPHHFIGVAAATTALELAKLFAGDESNVFGFVQSADPLAGRASRASAANDGEDDGRNSLETELLATGDSFRLTNCKREKRGAAFCWHELLFGFFFTTWPSRAVEISKERAAA
jgi:hypothetical protein